MQRSFFFTDDWNTPRDKHYPSFQQTVVQLSSEFDYYKRLRMVSVYFLLYFFNLN